MRALGGTEMDGSKLSPPPSPLRRRVLEDVTNTSSGSGSNQKQIGHLSGTEEVEEESEADGSVDVKEFNAIKGNLITLCTSASVHVKQALRWEDPAMTDVRRTGPPPTDLWASFHAKSAGGSNTNRTTYNNSLSTSTQQHIPKSSKSQPAPDFTRMTMPQLKQHVQTCLNVLSHAQRGEYLAWATHEANVRATEKAVKCMQVSLSLGLSLGFKGLFLYTVGILFNVECCIRQLSCSSIILYSITSIAYNYNTDI